MDLHETHTSPDVLFSISRELASSLDLRTIWTGC